VLANAGVCHSEKVSFENFDKILPLTKDIITNNFDALKSNDLAARNWYKNTSGGSSGTPVTFIQDKEYLVWNIANKIYLKEIGGQKMGDCELRLWGSERDILVGREKLSIRLRNWLYNRQDFNSFILSEQGMSDLYGLWNVFQPQWIEGYVQSVNEFARFVKRNKLVVTAPKGILTSAGTLYADMRETIENTFGAPVFNRYGSREVGDIACSCAKNDCLHLAPWNHYIEILDKNGHPTPPGVMGDIYVTLLSNYSMPLIRYKIGDIATAAENQYCTCGRASSIIANVAGRDVHLFKTVNGASIDGEYFTHLFYFKDWVDTFQVVQKKYNLIEIKVVRRSKPPLDDINAIERDIRVVMGNSCQITWSFPEAIPPLASGKFLYTISELRGDPT
jgi:phenylacetate-CoA ligase